MEVLHPRFVKQSVRRKRCSTGIWTKHVKGLHTYLQFQWEFSIISGSSFERKNRLQQPFAPSYTLWGPRAGRMGLPKWTMYQEQRTGTHRCGLMIIVFTAPPCRVPSSAEVSDASAFSASCTDWPLHCDKHIQSSPLLQVESCCATKQNLY